MRSITNNRHLHLAATILFILACLTSACNGPSAGVAETRSAAETEAALNPPETPTPLPTDTPIPTDTPTPTEIPTETPTPTETPLPTDTPTPTATPGPFTLLDDFTTDTGNWADCELCTWENNALTMGPFPASNRVMNMNLCSGCGAYSTYHFSVEPTTWASPPGSSTLSQNTMKMVTGGKRSLSNGAVRSTPAMPQTPSRSGWDIFIYLNDDLIHTLYNKPAYDAQVGLGINFHDVTVSYDNLVFEEIEVEP